MNCNLTVKSVAKSFGATSAIENASISLKSGEVHALLGENGAGKSTLVRILAGAVIPDRGEMMLHENKYSPQSILESRAEGVSTAFQELSLVSNLTVAQNLMLPHLEKAFAGLISNRKVVEKGEAILVRHGLERVNPNALISKLPLAERQRIEIVRALENAKRVLILDEPTASLAETDWLFDQIRKAQENGVAVLYISHRLAEVREICSVATVLRNGSSIASISLGQAGDADIFEMMVGHRIKQKSTSLHKAEVSESIKMSVNNLNIGKVKNVSFELLKGEVLGIAALEGQGQRELFRALAGLDMPSSGSIMIDGRQTLFKNPRSALRFSSGISYLPEERKTEGILAGLSAATNITLPIMSRIARGWFINQKLEEVEAKKTAKKVEMNDRYLSFPIDDLSGGNQQKALIARTLATGVQTLLLFDPTRGVDVGTKESIYAAIRNYAEQGGSVLFYSSELPEIVQLADRCFVVYDGEIFKSFTGVEIIEPDLVAAMIGHNNHDSESLLPQNSSS